jgi:hypothetical protein
VHLPELEEQVVRSWRARHLQRMAQVEQVRNLVRRPRTALVQPPRPVLLRTPGLALSIPGPRLSLTKSSPNISDGPVRSAM